MYKHFVELDSLRGLAALSVVLSHFFLVIPGFFFTSNFNNTPLHIFWAGHEAVILFFLLSGFVLALPYTVDKNPIYKSYLVKRICRIYIPYILAVFIGIICIVLFPRYGIEDLTDWFNRITTSTAIDVQAILNHIIFLGDYNSTTINFVIWSLIHEMRISIFFPILMILVMKLDWKIITVLCMIFSIMYHLIEVALNFQGYSDLYYSSFHRTIHYAGIFTLGALMAKNSDLLINIWTKQKLFIKVLLLLIGTLSYTYTWWFFPNVYIIHLEIINDWLIAFGSCIFIVGSLSSSMLGKILNLKPILFLGKISYSLYLFHGLVLLNIIYIFYNLIPYWAVLILAFLTSILIATISYYFIELPSIKLGRKLTNKNLKQMVNKKTRGVS